MKHKSLLSAKIQKQSQHAFESQSVYEARLRDLQKKMLSLQQSLHRSKKKIIIVFEGPDAAGKGGVIKVLTEFLDPRIFRVHAIGAPNMVEAQQNYFERFFQSLPKPGTIAIFDRSWYGRVLVERVEGLIPKRDWKRAYREINAVESMLTGDGVLVLKYLLDISSDEQKKRFRERAENPLKNWKLTDDDWRNRAKWDEYRKAYQDMIKETSSKSAPWKLIAADSKWSARVDILTDVLMHARKI